MTGKRKRCQVTEQEPQASAPQNGTPKPMSAIAAARLKATAPIPNVEEIQEQPTSPIAESPASEAAESEPEHIPLVHQNFTLSSPKSKTTVSSHSAVELTLELQKHATVALVGSFDVKVLKGAVNINGANLGAVPRKEQTKSHRVFVPSTHPITKIRGLDRTNHVQFLSCQEPAAFDKISPLFSDIWSGSGNREASRTFHRVTESDDDPLKRSLVPENVPEDWLRTIEEIATTASVTMIVGPPISGKSTFAARLLNRYLTGFGKTAQPVPAVCYLDLDPSKPEYTLHGLISLTIVRELNLGPAFTHPVTMPGRSDMNEIITAHAVPYDDLTNYEEHFIACAQDLFQTYQNLRLDGPTPPLIINTPPSLYTSHYPMLQALLTATKPNHLIHLHDASSIDEPTAAKLHDLETLATKTASKIHELSAQFPIIPPARTDASLRAMQAQSYFHSTGRSPKGNPTWDPRPLTKTPPWTFAYASTPTRTQDLHAILPLFSSPIPAPHLLAALNGTCVHIFSLASPHTSPISRTPKEHIPFFPPRHATGMTHALPPSATRYICTALIQGIDPPSHTINVLVPKPCEELLQGLEAGTTVFVAGCCDTPEWAYVEDAYYQVAKRRRDMGERAQFASEADLIEGVEVGPWVERGSVVAGMGSLGAVRRVRRFLG